VRDVSGGHERQDWRSQQERVSACSLQIQQLCESAVGGEGAGAVTGGPPLVVRSTAPAAPSSSLACLAWFECLTHVVSQVAPVWDKSRCAHVTAAPAGLAASGGMSKSSSPPYLLGAVRKGWVCI
jgi:hypothetical protein